MPNIAAVRDQNDNLTKIIKYIPTEAITLYTAAIGMIPAYKPVPKETDCKLHPELCSINEPNLLYFKITVIALFILTPVWKYFSVKDNPNPVGGNPQRAAIFHCVIAIISFFFYVYVSNDLYLNEWFKNSDGTNSKFLNPVVATLIMLFFSAIIPLLERIFLKSPPAPAPPPPPAPNS